MELFQLVIALLLGAGLLTTLSGRIGAPYPVILALAGAGLALVPTSTLPSIQLNPDLALTLFVAPVLLDAAFDTSLRDLRANWIPIVSLVLFCVAVTVVAVAVVARWLVPDMPWAVAIALGAIVAPPDATAATSVLRFVAPPHRMMVILEGETLLNDASALLIYRVAVAAAMGQSQGPATLLPAMLLSTGGGILLGFGAGRLMPVLTRHIRDIPVHIVLQFVTTFAVWLAAEHLDMSPILTVVVYAMTLSRSTGLKQDAENRRMSFAVWDVAVYALNAVAYILMGLQLREVIGQMKGQWPLYIAFSLAVLATVILARILWVLLYNRGWFAHRRLREWRGRDAEGGPSLKASLAVSWCGMRGIVTLATALALPFGAGDAAFPHRGLLVTAAFTVVLGTLLLQGMTLKPLLRWLDLHDTDEVGREERLARRKVTEAAIRSLRRRGEPEAEALRQEYQVRLHELSADAPVSAATISRMRLDAIGEERRVLERLRRNHTIGDTAYHTIEEELDWAEGHAVGRRRGGIDAPIDDEDGPGQPQEGSAWH